MCVGEGVNFGFPVEGVHDSFGEAVHSSLVRGDHNLPSAVELAPDDVHVPARRFEVLWAFSSQSLSVKADPTG